MTKLPFLKRRDLLIIQGKYPQPVAEGVVPGSDGAGTVIGIGSQVTRFMPGDKVVTYFNPSKFRGPGIPDDFSCDYGGTVDGVFRSVGVFPELGLVLRPPQLSALLAATLPSAGVTAWNALHGAKDHEVAPGQWILV